MRLSYTCIIENSIVIIIIIIISSASYGGCSVYAQCVNAMPIKLLKKRILYLLFYSLMLCMVNI